MQTIPNYQQIFKTSFATRLVSKLREKGFISRRGTNGVNGKQLAVAAGVSLPMARRYINAQSIPENVTLQKISNWLNVDPFWLLHGDNNTAAEKHIPINKELFIEIFNQMFPLLCNTPITKEQFTALITACLDIYSNVSSIDNADKPKRNAIALMVDFIKKNI